LPSRSERTRRNSSASRIHSKSKNPCGSTFRAQSK
jgi:hypothetical protein